jgi:arsenate reductase
MTEPSSHTPVVLFVCDHNAGRSQIAAAYLNHLGRGALVAKSAGSRPSAEVHPAVVEAMAEEGLDISAETPKELTDEALHDANMVITLAGSEAVRVIPGRKYEDWQLRHPDNDSLAHVRPLRDDIKARIQELLSELLPAVHPDAN